MRSRPLLTRITLAAFGVLFLCLLGGAAGILLGFSDTSPRTGGAKGVQFELFPDVAAVIAGETYRLIHG